MLALHSPLFYVHFRKETTLINTKNKQLALIIAPKSWVEDHNAIKNLINYKLTQKEWLPLHFMCNNIVGETPRKMLLSQSY